jgi:hypothetical protein
MCVRFGNVPPSTKIYRQSPEFQETKYSATEEPPSSIYWLINTHRNFRCAVHDYVACTMRRIGSKALQRAYQSGIQQINGIDQLTSLFAFGRQGSSKPQLAQTSACTLLALKTKLACFLSKGSRPLFTTSALTASCGPSQRGGSQGCSRQLCQAIPTAYIASCAVPSKSVYRTAGIQQNFARNFATRVELQRQQRLGRAGFRHDPMVQAQYLVSHQMQLLPL